MEGSRVTSESFLYSHCSFFLSFLSRAVFYVKGHFHGFFFSPGNFFLKTLKHYDIENILSLCKFCTKMEGWSEAEKGNTLNKGLFSCLVSPGTAGQLPALGMEQLTLSSLHQHLHSPCPSPGLQVTDNILLSLSCCSWRWLFIDLLLAAGEMPAFSISSWPRFI